MKIMDGVNFVKSNQTPGLAYKMEQINLNTKCCTCRGFADEEKRRVKSERTKAPMGYKVVKSENH